jgi:hypothetical protein
MLLTAIAATLTLPTLGQIAAPNPLIGVWTITYPWHLERENGVVKPFMETAQLTVEARGDSLIATVVTTHTSAYSPRRPFRLAAPSGSAEPTFVMRDQVTLNMRGATSTTTAITTWIMKPAGDRLGGTVERRMEAIPGRIHGPLPMTGTRIRP